MTIKNKIKVIGMILLAVVFWHKIQNLQHTSEAAQCLDWSTDYNWLSLDSSCFAVSIYQMFPISTFPSYMWINNIELLKYIYLHVWVFLAPHFCSLHSDTNTYQSYATQFPLPPPPSSLHLAGNSVILTFLGTAKSHKAWVSFTHIL